MDGRQQMTIDTKQLRDLLATAGKWPNEVEKINEADGSYYTCPACDGEGTIDAELVKTMHAGLVGVQVFGFGEPMEAMEELIPEIIYKLPAILDRLERLEAVAKAARNRTETFRLGSEETGRDGLDEWDALDEALARLDKP